jgi:hypothetical protein
MNSLYYRLWYRLDGVDRYLIWYNPQGVYYDADGVVLDAEGRIVAFANLGHLELYAAQHGIPLVDEEPILHDLDRVRQWLELRGKPARKHICRNTIHCPSFLAAWNLFGDIRYSLDPSYNKGPEPRNKYAYSKMFAGCNLPALTPPGKWYEPIWYNAEVKFFRKVLGEGLRLFRDRLTLWTP